MGVLAGFGSVQKKSRLPCKLPSHPPPLPSFPSSPPPLLLSPIFPSSFALFPVALVLLHPRPLSLRPSYLSPLPPPPPHPLSLHFPLPPSRAPAPPPISCAKIPFPFPPMFGDVRDDPHHCRCAPRCHSPSLRCMGTCGWTLTTGSVATLLLPHPGSPIPSPHQLRQGAILLPSDVWGRVGQPPPLAAGQKAPLSPVLSHPPPLSPIRCAKVPFSFPPMFGDVRDDPHHWLRDERRENPDVLAHLAAENAYSDALLPPCDGDGDMGCEGEKGGRGEGGEREGVSLRVLLEGEMKARVKQEDRSVPLRKGDFWYYTREEEGKQYPIHCRRAAADSAAAAEQSCEPRDYFSESMDEGVPEEVVLDENREAEGRSFFHIDSVAVSPNHGLVAYSLDTRGDERYAIHVRPIGSGYDNQTLFYVAQDEKDRPCFVMRHVIGTPVSQDACVFFEKDEAFDVGVHRASSDRFIIVTCASAVTSFLLAIDVQRPFDPPKQLVPRVHNVEVYGDHSGSHFFLLCRSDQMRNSELLALPVSQTDHSGSHFFLLRRSDQMRNSELLSLPVPVADTAATVAAEAVEPSVVLPHDPRVEFDEAAYEIRALRSRFESPLLRFSFSSLVTPPPPCLNETWTQTDRLRGRSTGFESSLLRYSFSSLVIPTTVFERDMDTDRQAARKVDWVGPSFDPSLYSSRRLFHLLHLLSLPPIFYLSPHFSSLSCRSVHPSTHRSTPLAISLPLKYQRKQPCSLPLPISPHPSQPLPISPMQVGESFNPSLYSSRRLFATAKDGTQVPISLVHRNSPSSAASAPTDSPDAAASSGPPWPMLLYAYGAYECTAVAATAAADGTQVPISLVHRNSTCSAPNDPPWPMLLYAYGAYEVPTRLSFSSDRLSLLDRGVAVAIAHVRGGGDWDYQWYLDGKLLRKRNTVWDMIACAEHLIKEGLTTPDRLALEGRSSGGIPVGAAVNERPDLFRSAVAGVPFVDVLSTMLDASLHLTITEWEEWGNPQEEQYYHYIKSYSPVDNVSLFSTPHLHTVA
ncbi:unnamed protein product [Closterium sp. Yama58-4]|nr:unnamed protein product [Closterium sp. Yama58-4]